MKEIELKPWSMNDLPVLVKFANNPKVAANLTNGFPHPYTEEAGKAFIEMALSHQPTRIFAITLDGSVVGSIGLHPQQDIFCKNAELGYWLAEPYWGQGITTIAVKKIISYGFKNFDVVRIFARPFSSNIASQKVLEKAGMQKEAHIKNSIYKNGVILDELIYSILL